MRLVEQIRGQLVGLQVCCIFVYISLDLFVLLENLFDKFVILLLDHKILDPAVLLHDLAVFLLRILHLIFQSEQLLLLPLGTLVQLLQLPLLLLDHRLALLALAFYALLVLNQFLELLLQLVLLLGQTGDFTETGLWQRV
jgi:hypothetical protein